MSRVPCTVWLTRSLYLSGDFSGYVKSNGVFKTKQLNMRDHSVPVHRAREVFGCVIVATQHDNHAVLNMSDYVKSNTCDVRNYTEQICASFRW